MLIVVLSLGNISFVALLMTYLNMSIMFPTIFALSIQDAGDQKEKGSSILVMSIVGGAIIPPLMGIIGESNISFGFIIPLICFMGVFSFAVYKIKFRLKHE